MSLQSTNREIHWFESMEAAYASRAAPVYGREIVNPFAEVIDRLDGEPSVVELADVDAMLVDVLRSADIAALANQLGPALFQSRLLAVMAVLGEREGNELNETFVTTP